MADQREDLYAAGGFLCRGSMALGSGCGRCRRCVSELSAAAQALPSLHRPLDGGTDVRYKGGLPDPDLAATRLGMLPISNRPENVTGWICPKCQQSNAPTQPTCFHCAMREGARS